MALLFVDGFDAGTTPLRWANATSVSDSAATRYGSGMSASVANTGFARNIPESTKVYVGAAIMATQLDSTIRPYVGLRSDNNTLSHLIIGYGIYGIRAYRGAIGGTPIASYDTPMNPNSWYYLEVSATIADSGGTCQVRLDGTLVIDYTGDTRNGGTVPSVSSIALGSNGGWTMRFDDFYVCDGTGPAPYNEFLGEVRVHTLVPDGPGAYTQFNSSGGANYTAVDELPYSSADYVSSSTSGHKDSYTMQNLPAGVSKVLAVQTNAVLRKNDAGSVVAKMLTRSNGVDSYGAATSIGSTNAVISDLRAANPSTGSGWTTADVNDMEAGIELV